LFLFFDRVLKPVDVPFFPVSSFFPRVNSISRSPAEKKQLASLFYLFEEAAKANPNARAIWSRTGCYTYAELYTRVLRYANYFRAVLCIQPGTIVGLYSPNTPEFIFIWFGLWAIGCAPAMINFNLAGAALVHCIKLSGCKHIFVDNSMDVRARVEASGDDLREAGVNPVFLTGEFKANIAYEQLATRPPNSMRDHVKGTFPMALIYVRICFWRCIRPQVLTYPRRVERPACQKRFPLRRRGLTRRLRYGCNSRATMRM